MIERAQLFALGRSVLVKTAAWLVFWTALTLAMAGYFVVASVFSWDQALRVSLRDWVSWAILSPLVVWLALRFPLERTKLWRSAPAHIAGCALAVAACGAINDWLMPWTGPGFGRPPRRPPPTEGMSAPLSREERQPGPPHDRPPPPREYRGRRPPPSSWLWLRAKINIPIYWVIVSVVHALTYYRRSQERERKALELSASLAQARLQALKLQLQPHFLFNTLNAIAALVHKDPHAADDMISNLSELLRQSLDSSDLQEVPLRKEMEFLDCYLEIERMRLGDRLRVEKDIAAETLDAQVPVMILQPLVENAIRHGIEPSRAPGIVTVQAGREGDWLLLTVRDNGVGTNAGTPGNGRAGIGLANTRARLQELYPNRAELVMEPASQGGVSVSLRLPFHTRPVTAGSSL
ncbi:MAG: sensor histidine kinase [Verrucomicrobiae bacterium]|nr:sensor histidine kinase [Verrucomicrobiae bacterium]